VISLLHTLLAALPLNARILIGRILGTIYSLLPLREKKIARLQMMRALGPHYRPGLLREVFANTGQTVMECLNLRPYTDNIDKYVTCDNWEVAEKLKEAGSPILVLTAHTGNWDLLAAYAIKKGFKVATIAREARNPKLQGLLSKIRDSYGIKTIWKDSPKSTLQILRCLKPGGLIAALIDQDIESESIHVPFFNMPAKYPIGLIKLGKKSNAQLVAAFIFRQGIFNYKIYLNNLDCSRPEDEILAEYSNLLENYIIMHPDQWVWFHKRWRSLEDGKRLSTREYLKYLEKYETVELDKAS
jgi:KDO2-lipid IV(A) lauroyltransferase